MSLATWWTSVTKGAAVVESDFVKGLKIIEEFVVPIAQVAVASIPGINPKAADIIANVPTLMAGVEQMFPNPGSGSIKLDGVLAMAQASANLIDGVSTGGQAKTWSAISQTVTNLVNNSVSVVNAIQPVVDAATVQKTSP